jgi:lipopolysaccharide export LptBFGC system permease protein LptF
MGGYWVLFTAGEIAGERGWVPVPVGMWAANFAVFGIGMWLMDRSIRGDS